MMRKFFGSLTFKAVLAITVVLAALLDGRIADAQQVCSSTGGACKESCFSHATQYCSGFGERCVPTACETTMSCGLFQVQVTCGAQQPEG